MKRLAAWICCALLFASATGWTQSSQRIRGDITGFDGHVLTVKARDGRELKITVAEKASIVTAKSISLKELQGKYVGVTAVKGPDGNLVAREVHTLAPTSQAGHTAWDLEPGATMTNATLDAIVQSAGTDQITLNYKDGTQTVRVPAGVPIVTQVEADRSALKVGEYIFTVAAVDAAGNLTASRIQVSKDGVRPPQ